VRRAALAPLAGALLLLVGLGGVGAETYRLAWSYQTGAEVWSVSISSDGNYIAAGSGDNRVYLFSRSSGLLWSYQTGGLVYSISISSDGNYIAAGSWDNRVYLFSRSSGLLWSYQTGAEVWSVSISSDGNYIAAGSYDRVYLFSRSSGLLWSYQTGGVVLLVSISSDGNYIAAGSYDRVYLFSRSSSTPLWSYQTGSVVWSVSISFDGSYIAAGSHDNRVYLFSRSSSTPLWSYQTGGWVYPISISSDGNYIAAGSYDRVYLFSRSSGLLWSYQTGGWVPSVSISSDGSYIAAGSYDDRVYLFSRSSSTPLWSYQTGNAVRSVSISSDGNYIATGSQDYRVYLLSKNRPPVLSSGSVSPSAGTTRDTFTYEVTYSDPDGDSPASVMVYIDGTAHAMSYASGSYTAGAVYRYYTTLPFGSHTYFFEASDGTDTVRLPSSGTYSGPSVGLQPTSLSVSPSSFTLGLGQTQTLTATLTAGGTPLSGRTVSWSATAGSVSPSSGLTDSSGRVTAVYTAPDTPTTATITASFAGDAEYGSSYGLSSATVRFESVLVFTKPDGTPLAYTEIYYGTSEGQETALLGTTDGAGRITLTDPALRGTTLYFRSGDGKYRGSYYIPSGGGTLSVQLTRTLGRGLLPLVLILVVVGAAVAGTVAWRRGLLRKPAGARPPGKPAGPFCPHCKLKLPPDAQFCPECGRKVKGGG
jgi:WD40 repeat protein